jgi:hypothetical protein
VVLPSEVNDERLHRIVIEFKAKGKKHVRRLRT